MHHAFVQLHILSQAVTWGHRPRFPRAPAFDRNLAKSAIVGYLKSSTGEMPSNFAILTHQHQHNQHVGTMPTSQLKFPEILPKIAEHVPLPNRKSSWLTRNGLQPGQRYNDTMLTPSFTRNWTLRPPPRRVYLWTPVVPTPCQVQLGFQETTQL